MKETSVADRLKQFIESKDLTYSQFADTCGIPRPSLSQLLTGRNKKINDIMVGQIHNMFPELSIVWLLFGEGPMENSNELNRTHELDLNETTDETIENSTINDAKKIIFSGRNGNHNEFRKDNSLNLSDKVPQLADIKIEKLQKKIRELEGQIENLKKNPRKAVNITVYYDDSTFETFYP